MADIVARIPENLDPLIEDIKRVKAENSEPTSRKAILAEAVKNLHRKVVKK